MSQDLRDSFGEIKNYIIKKFHLPNSDLYPSDLLYDPPKLFITIT